MIVWVYFGAGFVREIATDYLTGIWRIVPMFSSKSINGSVEWMGVPEFLRTNGPAGTANILSPCPSWVDRGSVTNLNWGSQYRGCSYNVSVPWNYPIRVLLVYTIWSLKTYPLLHATSLTISFELIVRQALQSHSTCRNPIISQRIIRRMMTGMIYGMSQLINNLCGECPLVVSISVTFPLFPSLVWAAKNSSLFGYLSASPSSEL